MPLRPACSLLLLLLLPALGGCDRRVTRAELTFSTQAARLPDATAFGALGDSLTTVADRRPAVLDAYQLPDLWLPLGQVVAADGLAPYGATPFTRTFRPGRYPVLLGVARLPPLDERVAFALLRVAAAPVVRWELAVRSGQDTTRMGADEFFGYGVDSGTGAFYDPAALALAVTGGGPSDDFFQQALDAMGSHHWLHVQTPAGGASLFSSGYGDGAYASYFGLDSAGRVAALLTDFEVVAWPRRPR